MTIDPVLKWSFLGVGLFGLGFAILLVRRPLHLLRAGGKAQGTITGNEEKVITGGRGPARTYYFPKITYTTAKGEKIAFTSESGRRIAHPPGTVVPLIYDPAEPSGAAMYSFVGLWLFPLALSVFTLPFLAVGLMGVFS